MKKINLFKDSGGQSSSSGMTPRTKRLLIVLVCAILLAVAIPAAQRFFFQEKTPPPLPSRPLAAKPAPAPAPIPGTQAPEAPTAPSGTPAPPLPSTDATASKAEEGPKAALPPSAPPGTQAPEAPKAPSGTPAPPLTRTEPTASKPQDFRETPREMETPKRETRAKLEERARPSRPGYSLQVISVQQERNADSVMSQLKAAGLSPRLVKAKSMLPKHSVFLGDFSGPEEAREMGTHLQEEGISATLTKMEKGRYGFLASSSFTLNEAVDTAHELEKKNLTPRIRTVMSQAHEYQVRVGRFRTREEAEESGERLRKMGYPPLVVRE